MAMRIFTRPEFEKELERAGLVRTNVVTATSRLWRAPNGRHLTIPEHADAYPDSVLEDVLRQLGLLYQKPGSS